MAVEIIPETNKYKYTQSKQNSLPFCLPSPDQKMLTGQYSAVFFCYRNDYSRIWDKLTVCLSHRLFEDRF